MKMIALGALGAVLLLSACAPHPAHPIATPPLEPVYPAHPIAGPPAPVYPAHPIVYPHLGLLARLSGKTLNDLWLNTPCEGTGEGQWCGHIPLPHVEHY